MTRSVFWSKLIEIGNKPFKAEKLRYRLFFFLILSFILVSYSLRGLTTPWLYGYFNFTFNWLEGGYITRGLFGTLAQLLLGKKLALSNTFLTLVQYVFAWVMIIYLVYICYQLVMKSGNLFCGFIVLIYATSTFNMFYMSEIGFLDHVAFCLIAIALEICLRCKVKTSIVWCAILAPLTVCLLNTGAFNCCPIIASLALLKVVHEEKKLSIKRLLTLIGAFIPTIIVIFCLTFTTTDIDAWNNYINSIKNMPYFDQEMADYLIRCWLSPVSAIKSWIYLEPAVFVYAAVFITLTIAFLFFATNESNHTVIWFVVMSIACMFIGYAEIYFGSDFHRYYFDAVFAVFMLSIYMLRIHQNKYMDLKKSLLAIILSIVCIRPVFHYRLWIWNRKYNDFWFMSLLI